MKYEKWESFDTRMMLFRPNLGGLPFLATTSYVISNPLLSIS